MRVTLRTSATTGFTLLELVVASFVAMLVIAGMYVVFGANSRVFRGQEAAAQSQVEIRFAMDTLRDDLGRAGFLAPADTDESTAQLTLCEPHPGAQLTAVAHAQGAGAAYLPLVNVCDPADNTCGGPNPLPDELTLPDQAPDDLTLMGSYGSGDVYWVKGINGTNVEIQNTYAIDSTDPFPRSEEAFNEIFAPDRTWARIVYENKVFIQPIADSDWGPPPTIELANAPACAELSGISEGAELNVISKVRYSVRQPAAAELTLRDEALQLSSEAAAWINARRSLYRDIIATDGTVAFTEVVAENVVDFQVWFLFDEPDPAGVYGAAVLQGTSPFPDADIGPSGAGAPCGAGDGLSMDATDACSARNVRGAIVRMSVRTEREDPNLIWLQGQPLRRYDVDPASEGAARVRTLMAQFSLPNLGTNP